MRKNFAMHEEAGEVLAACDRFLQSHAQTCRIGADKRVTVRAAGSRTSECRQDGKSS
jgi:hypothetical protein